MFKIFKSIPKILLIPILVSTMCSGIIGAIRSATLHNNGKPSVDQALLHELESGQINYSIVRFLANENNAQNIINLFNEKYLRSEDFESYFRIEVFGRDTLNNPLSIGSIDNLSEDGGFNFSQIDENNIHNYWVEITIKKAHLTPLDFNSIADLVNDLNAIEGIEYINQESFREIPIQCRVENHIGISYDLENNSKIIGSFNMTRVEEPRSKETTYAYMQNLTPRDNNTSEFTYQSFSNYNGLGQDIGGQAYHSGSPLGYGAEHILTQQTLDEVNSVVSEFKNSFCE